MFLNRRVRSGEAFAVYAGWVYAQGDPQIPVDNSYQINLTIGGTHFVLDADGVDQSVCKGQFINDGLRENAECRIRPAPNSAKYCLVYALDSYAKDVEMETTYDREYWRRKIQWDKLSEDDKCKASELYNISQDLLV